MWWKDILIGTTWIARDEQTHDIPAILAAIFFYVVSFIICYVTFRITKLILPESIHSLTTEFVKTLLVCTYPYGHGLVRYHYGNIGYFFTAVPLVVLTLSLFPQGLCSPLSIFVLFLKGQISLFNLIFRTVIQTLGAFTSYKLAMFVWSFGVHSEHTKQFHATLCQTDLNVTVQVGFLLELLCVAFDTWLGFKKLSKSDLVDSTIKIANSTLMVCLGVHLTGMYLHPAMASALTYSCQGSSAFDHIAVYWVSAFIGCYLGYILHHKIKITRMDTHDLRHRKMNGSGDTKKSK
ncbi:hypothetical protein LOTGIDRAFT_205153 [Lottia gigantea]|uniref:Aquaporin n=1 Tax=Lottia gigantea TaxID=225164 RepID=V4B655_LOTGI|nr:hypothetical protein LOTGIDRAFT_205153 [Lottia gigantea]ESP01577.1 hypothetical protein LOTGIDRAFT_205153 [Lottia gigantea]